MRTLKYLASAALALGACDSQPEELNHYFGWTESVSEMRDALLGACADASGKVYAVGGLYRTGALYRWTSRRWLQEATTISGRRLWSCWAGDQDRVFAVGQEGTIFQHTAEGWHRGEVPEEVAGATLYSVWGMPDGTAVAVGGGLPEPTATAVILHYDGQSWTRANAQKVRSKTLRGVWGTSPTNYWAVGDDGAIAHFDGEEWLPSPSRVDDRLNAVYGVSDGEIYAVGGTGRGLILRWNGSSWVSFDEPPGAVQTVWTSPQSALYVAGDAGFVGRYTRLNDLPDRRDGTFATPFPHLRVNALVGLGSALLGAAATMRTGDDGDWRGSVVSHKRSFAGPVFVNSLPDAGLPDGGPLDAALPDAQASDSGPVDAQAPDAR